MSEPAGFPISSKTISNLNDKLYEKRKLGALEVEEVVKQLVANKDQAGITALINFITATFTASSNANARKGGLIGLAAIGIGLGAAELGPHLPAVCAPVLRCFADLDSRVRYYACEALYNVAKVARGRIVAPLFNDIFDGLCKLAADPDLNVKNGAQLLDRLVKDIVTESNALELERFVPLLRERIHVANPFVRAFLLGWLGLLDSLPDLELLQHLPAFLDGLFAMLADTRKDIRKEAENTLGEFLRQVRVTPLAPGLVAQLTRLLAPYLASADDPTRLHAIAWLNEFLAAPSPASTSSPISTPASSSAAPDAAKSGSSATGSTSTDSSARRGRGRAQVSEADLQARRAALVPLLPELLPPILLGLAHEQADIATASVRANSAFQSLVGEATAPPVQELLSAIMVQLLSGHVPTRLAALDWIGLLHARLPARFASHVDELFPALLKMLNDPAEDVVRHDLALMARVAHVPAHFDRLMRALVSLFYSDTQLLERRGTVVVRQLALHMDAERVFMALAELIAAAEEEDFASVLVGTMNVMLLTCPEFYSLRASLRQVGDAPSGPRAQLFSALYRSWAHAPSALLGLCLLAGCYSHACELIACMSELEVTVNLLVEVDKLVQLLESPIFAPLRLRLLQPDRHPDLFRALYGLLMLLPQSSAYETLKSRLNSITSLGVLHLIPRAAPPALAPACDIDFAGLLEHFRRVQDRHARARRQQPLADAPSRAQQLLGPLK